ncbi:MAG: CusA/CzcA family heavy metal efflux RND transporter [Reyranella sp.]|uniref:efflux RND transporter permease subunit n=1 Tax=Reyranella sp. TaxID=1929291 RepID=UPI001AD3B4DB|nr:CusA/CzcA family heavy metal efflux RND transporter [Reyranella sp.]MBN9086302.1 CusA/CzcA family heavy metal efflux RND transporter [Reyranella sp.]
MLRWVISASLNNRFVVLLLAAAVAVGGIFAAVRLPLDAVPDITNRQVQINTLVPSLSPEEVEARVTFRIETAVAGTPGLVSTRSISRNGFSQVTAVFTDGTDIYFARQQLTERLISARENLPAGAEPVLGPNATGLGEVYWWTLSFDRPPAAPHPGPGLQPNGAYVTPNGDVLRTALERATYLRTLQDWTIRPRLLAAQGVAGVDSIGGYVRQLEVQPDPARLIAYGISLDEVAAALGRSNVATGAGYLESRGAAYLVRADSRFRDSEDVLKTVIAVRDSTPITVGDLAKVVPGKELRSGSASANGEEVVLGIGLMRIGGNSRTVADRLKEILPSLPPGVRVTPVLDRTELVNSTIHTVATNLAEGALLVIAVLFLTIGNLRAALITALVIPLAILATAIGMVEKGVSANLMSLGALDFGLIVDGAIIIVENSLRHLHEERARLGRLLIFEERREVVTRSTYEMIQPSVYGQMIIIIVYIPMLLLTGVEGKMFTPMAMTVIFALAAAFVLSLTVIPALILTFLGGSAGEREGYITVAARRFYAPLLEITFRRRGSLLAGAMGLVALSVLLFLTLGQEFIPTLDEGNLAAETRKIPGVSLTTSTRLQQVTENSLSKVPEVSVVVSKTGAAELATDPMGPEVSDVYIILKPRERWPDPDEPKSALIARLREAVEKVPGTSYEFSQPIQLRFNELIAGVKSDLAIKVFGDDLEVLRDIADQVASVVSKVRGTSGVRVEQTIGQPIVTVKPDRTAVARYGVAVPDIHDTLTAAVIGRTVGQMYDGTLSYPLVLRFADPYRSRPEALGVLPVPLPSATSPPTVAPLHNAANLLELPPTNFVPLSEVARIEVNDGLSQISREYGKRRVTVSANVRGRDLGSTVDEARRQIVDKVKLPAGVWIEWGGQFENLQSARRRLSVVVPLCLAAILALLYGALGSLRQSLIVFTGVPLALTGGVLGLLVSGMPFSVSAAVGFIALSGVAVLNGLVLASSINGRLAEGMGVDQAVRLGAQTRLRPVLMTMLVASLGFVPMAVATGAGAEVQRPLAVVVIGGLVTSTLLTLLVLPTVYRLFVNHRRT